MRLFDAIKIAHKGLTKEIEYVRLNGIAVRMTDQAYNEYKEYTKAIDYLLDNHSRLFSFLKRIGFI